MKATRFDMKIIILLSIVVIMAFFIMLSACSDSEKNAYSLKSQSDSIIINGNEQADSEILYQELRKITITHYAKVKTSYGSFYIALYGKDAPKTVDNFLGLAKNHYYDGMHIHRVAHDFLIQMGCPYTKQLNKKSLWGSGGESIYGGAFESEINLNSIAYKVGYVHGTVAMAKKGKNGNLSQFFICLADAKNLQPVCTIFGRVISRMDVVEKIAKVSINPSSQDEDDGIPIKPIKIFSIAVEKMK